MTISIWTQSKFDSLVNETLDDNQLPGASAQCFYDGQVFSSAHGYVDADKDLKYEMNSIFRIGCCVKVLTAMQLLILRDEGKLDFDAPFVQYVPRCRKIEDERLNFVTIRQLLLHKSGLPPNIFIGGDGIETSQLLEALASISTEDRFIFPPGELCAYSTFGYIVLAAVIEELRGVSWTEDLTTQILNPLDITCHQLTKDVNGRRYAPHGEIIRKDYECADHFRTPVDVLPAEGGGMALSCKDLLTIARLHLDRGVTQHGVRLLSEQSVSDMQSDLSIPTGPWGGLNGLAYGWLALSNGSFSFPGDGTRNHVVLRIHPEKNIALAVVANYHSASVLFEGIWRELSPTSVKPPAQQPKPIEWANKKLLGEYFAGTAILTVYEEAGDLMVRVSSSALSKYTNSDVIAALNHVKDNHYMAKEIGNFCNLWFLDIAGAGNVDYIWCGVSLLKRIS